MPSTMTQPKTEKIRDKPSLPVDAPDFEKTHHKQVDVPMDYKIQELEDSATEIPVKQRKKLYSHAFRLNGNVDEVRNCIKGIEGLISIKTNAVGSDEELYQIGPGYIGLHPSKGYINVNGVGIEAMDKFVNLFYEVENKK